MTTMTTSARLQEPAMRTGATPPLYLSRLLLNPRSRQVQAELRDPYQMHRTLCKAFGDGPGELGASRCLFRVEEGCASVVPVLVQSLALPDWGRLTVSEGYLGVEAEWKAFAPTFVGGQRLRFRLRANPTLRRSEAVAKMGKRIGVYGEGAQRAWLARKGEAGGFAVVDCRVIDGGHVVCRRGGDGPPQRHLCVTYDGLLEVTDPDRFLSALASGIGSAKAFGFGLLSVARV